MPVGNEVDTLAVYHNVLTTPTRSPTMAMRRNDWSVAMPWDVDWLNRRFLNDAERAEEGMRDVPRRIKRMPDREAFYSGEFDLYSAEFFVFNHLHGRSFSETPQRFIAELRRMLTDVPSTATVKDQGRFAANYTSIVNRLIAEFEPYIESAADQS